MVYETHYDLAIIAARFCAVYSHNASHRHCRIGKITMKANK